MITFKKLLEIRNNKLTHKNGTYMCLKFDVDTVNKLDDFSKKHKIENPIDKKDFHTTVIFSKGKGAPDIANYKVNFPIIAKPKKFAIFGEKNNNLVLVVDCPEIVRIHKEIMKIYRTNFDFEHYVPHVTFSYDYSGEIPKELPNFNLVYNRKLIEELDTNR